MRFDFLVVEASSDVNELTHLSLNSMISNNSEPLPTPEEYEASAKHPLPPELYLAYPNLGQLLQVFLNMGSFDGYRREGPSNGQKISTFLTGQQFGAYLSILTFLLCEKCVEKVEF